MIVAVVPTRYRPDEMGRLLVVLAADGVETIILESAEYDHSVYAMWNDGCRRGRQFGADHIAILNDDITILPGTLPLMAEALRSNPAPAHWVDPVWPTLAVAYPDTEAPWTMPTTTVVRRTTGTWGSGGMTGFCFMLRADLSLPDFDERYHWWYGDDAFEQGVRDAGYGVGRVVGVPISHTPNGSASKRWDELAPLIEEDRVRWEAAWEARSARAYSGERTE